MNMKGICIITLLLISITTQAQTNVQDIVSKTIAILKDSMSKYDYEQRVYILQPDGHTAFVVQNAKRTSFTHVNINLGDDTVNRETLFLFPTPIDTNDDNEIEMPPGGYTSLTILNLSKDIKMKGDTLIYTTPYGNAYREYGNRYGIWQYPNNYNLFSYAWLFPDEWKPIYYHCNIPGRWEVKNNLIHFISKPNFNNYLFEIRYVRTHTIPKTIEGRTVNYTQTLQVNSDTIQVIINDPQREDGDIISLNVNGDWKLKNYEVTNAPAKFTFTLGYAENYIALHAENVGSIPPNTAMLTIIDGKQRKQVILNSDMGKTEAILLKRTP